MFNMPPPSTTSPEAAAAGALFLAMLACAHGCGRSGAVASDGEIVEADAGFALRVPEYWEVRSVAEDVRLVGQQVEADGYPTIQISSPTASELPVNFMEGRRFEWSGGDGAYRYSRWSNSLGNGFRLSVDLRGEHINLVVVADLWDRSITMDRRFFRRRVWPVINSLEVVPEG
jgi:hypothetical protein